MDCIEILKKLIKIDTVNPPGREKAAAEYLKSVLEPWGFQCEVQELGDGRANLIAVVGDEGPELMLNGHLDVVPAGDRWNSDPFSLIQEGDRVYGRGTSDMKGGIAAMCEAGIRAVQKGLVRHGRLKLLFVADEECSNLGIREYQKRFEPGQYAIIGEPTDLRIAVAHRGVSRDYLDLFGTQRHAALPPSEHDSIVQTVKAVQAIEEINRRLQEWKHEVLPSPGISITMIQGYEKDNVVPGQIRLLLDFRILPGMSHEEVAEILDKGMQDYGVGAYHQSLHFYMPGGEVPSNDPFADRCLQIRNSMLGDQDSVCAFDASCEQCFLTAQGISAIICGPGNLAQAHSIDEYAETRQIYQAVELYEKIIGDVLGSRERA